MKKMLVALLIGLSCKLNAKEIAITFDDTSIIETKYFANKLERAHNLAKNIKSETSEKVVFFANSKNFEESKNVLDFYSKQGYFIANHSNGHEDLNKIEASIFIESIKNANTLLEQFSTFKKWFRFPFLHEGDSLEKREVVRGYLKANGYKNGFVTVDSSDWYFNSLLMKTPQEKIDLILFKKNYIDSIIQAIEHFNSLAENELHLNVPHTLLLHESDLNALFIADLIREIKNHGYKIVSPEKAFNSDFANVEHKTLYANDGKIAALLTDRNYKGQINPLQNSINYIDEKVMKTLIPELQISGYKVNLKVDFANKKIYGEEKIYINTTLTKLNFKVGANISIDEISSDSNKITYVKNKDSIDVTLLKNQKEIFIKYTAIGTDDLYFGKNFVYTLWDNSNFMILKDENYFRAKLDLNIEDVNRNNKFQTVGSQNLNERVISPYLYGFAYGDFKKTSRKVNDVWLNAYSISLTPKEVEAALDKAEDTLSFVNKKLGVNLHRSSYDMVFVPNDEAQEKFGFSILGEGTLREMIKNPKDDWMIVHEFLHEWFGSLVTCNSWKHIWLNEGLTVYYTTFYKKYKWGDEEFNREVALAETRYAKAIEMKNNYPIVSKVWDEGVLARGITYSKAMLALKKLSERLGEDKFNKIVSDYLIKNKNGLAVTSDFRDILNKYQIDNVDVQKLFEEMFYKDTKLSEIK